MNMTASYNILQCTPYQLRFQVMKPIRLDELRNHFFCSKKHWNRCTDFSIPTLEPKKNYTISFKMQAKSCEYSNHPVSVVYEDSFCIVAFKPAFLLVHDDGHHTDTLQGRINAYLDSQKWPYNAQAIHRIDTEASGLVLFCKFPFFQPFFDHQMGTHLIQKEYLCIVKGILSSKHGILQNPIAKDRHDAKKMRISKTGKPCSTLYTVLEEKSNTSLIQVQIQTGRRHQIRVHMKNLGHPIYNDPLYGKIEDSRGMLLQSNQLRFHVPFQKDPVTLISPKDPRMILE